MTEYIPAQKLRRLAIKAESTASIMPNDTPAERFGENMAEQIRECLDKERLSKSEICDTETKQLEQ